MFSVATQKSHFTCCKYIVCQKQIIKYAAIVGEQLTSFKPKLIRAEHTTICATDSVQRTTLDCVNSELK